ncbi:MAG: Asp-tRNA(Asn)/Glu-tRNA(Gln) amidotransferase subunit GatC [Bacteroidota bacterium]|nr:Asp-tRNA(Asn)/Glu-tRNA(Gln) amidotransferase subunit GatC [Bacteroidota bacterium]MDP4191656.1 Asp-tRNA(Asn)/Glu-tRNA(Gln) amidotransferase subunit GatC [Bacteroidota bacterium]MDP4194368.1 Asp-tRNA(Asn)/Glu-tRNA(Gln) amidotransferase subunit GatC [Bacteroidota bacterium]
MPVSKKDVEHIAELAKLSFEESEIESFTGDLNEILSYVEKLNELNTDNVEPLSYPIPGQNVFRDDISTPSASTQEALKNAPDKDESFFKVPKVINMD